MHVLTYCNGVVCMWHRLRVCVLRERHEIHNSKLIELNWLQRWGGAGREHSFYSSWIVTWAGPVHMLLLDRAFPFVCTLLRHLYLVNSTFYDQNDSNMT